MSITFILIKYDSCTFYSEVIEHKNIQGDCLFLMTGKKKLPILRLTYPKFQNHI